MIIYTIKHARKFSDGFIITLKLNFINKADIITLKSYSCLSFEGKEGWTFLLNSEQLFDENDHSHEIWPIKGLL